MPAAPRRAATGRCATGIGGRGRRRASFPSRPVGRLSRRAADLRREETYRNVRQLIAVDLLDESADGRIVAFPQIHLRDAVYNAMTDLRRSELHLRAGNALEAMFETVGSTQLIGQVADHYARAGENENGIRYAVQAGHLATRTVAHRAATEFHRSPLELLDCGVLDE